MSGPLRLVTASLSPSPSAVTEVFCPAVHCEPNLHIEGQIAYVASRDIGAGEELTMDYGICCIDPSLQLNCSCGAPECRRLITGLDWKLPQCAKEILWQILLVGSAGY